MSLAAPIPSTPRISEPVSTPVTYGAPYTYLPPREDGLPLIFASPHSGQYYPDTMRDALCVPLIDLQRTEDAYVDDLFAAAAGRGAGFLTARYARAFVDLNRDPLELDKRMFDGPPPRRCGMPGPRVEAGLGCIPRVGARGHTIYRTRLAPEEGEARLRDVHDRYHRHLSAELSRLHALHGMAYLIDCHSMPSRQPSRRPLAEIVLGDRFGSSCCGRLTSLIEKRFRRLGYTVARNAPYAGGYTTLRYGRPQRGLHAIQIEIRRDLYMDELRVQRAAGFSQLAHDVSEVVADLVAHVTRQARKA
ncbi:MAG: N-formylglutamate amidohydrolase [Hyphomonadaceae bacterium]|nr:N-formylglutamate amidohydrolase [Hyphomonadaceae bacterium]